MNMQVRVEALKQQLEQLFPGKWLNGQMRPRNNINTGIEGIDAGVTRGIARKRITEWSGPLSSGKTSLLRSAVAHWCAQGLNVAYIDCEGKLYPADWASITAANSADQKVVPINLKSELENESVQQKGKFWIIRPSEKNENKSASVVPLISKRNLLMQEAIWSADQFIRSNAFDIVILDLGSNQPGKKKGLGMGYSPAPGKIYTRLQRSLDKSKAALIVVSDTSVADEDDESNTSASNNWGCHARFTFNRGLAVKCEAGLNGVAMIVPTIRLSAWRDGLSQEVEVNLGSSVPNRLYTHTQIPDRRTSKG
jgi:hypothetical protein